MIETVGSQLVVAIVLIVVGALLKRGISASEEVLKTEIKAVKKEQMRMNGSVKDIIEKHENCREELPDRFVGIDDFKERKQEVNHNVEQLFERLNPMAEDIAAIKTKVEG
jgi:uncharacterized coiled-coil DUF342 family protein